MCVSWHTSRDSIFPTRARMPGCRFKYGATILHRVVCGITLIPVCAFPDLCADKHTNKIAGMQIQIWAGENPRSIP
jgi:hypothetical protein